MSNSQVVRNYSNRIGATNTFARTIPVITGNEVGSRYLYDEFKEIDLIMTYFGDTLRLDDANYHLELKTVVYKNENRYESIRSNFIKSFNVDDGTSRISFINKQSFVSDRDMKLPEDIGPEGFWEEIFTSDRCTLLREWTLDITEPTYNEALNVGTKERVLKSEFTNILVYKGKFYTDFKLNNKNLKSVFQADFKKIKSFMKDNSIRTNERNDLIKVITFACQQDF